MKTVEERSECQRRREIVEVPGEWPLGHCKCGNGDDGRRRKVGRETVGEKGV